MCDALRFFTDEAVAKEHTPKIKIIVNAAKQITKMYAIRMAVGNTTVLRTKKVMPFVSKFAFNTESQIT